MNHSKTIYLVDDDQDDRYLIRGAIKAVADELTIIEAENGLNFLELVGKTAIQPSLILLDMNMPKMDGLETISAIRSDAALAAIPVIMISTSNDSSLARRAYDAGIDSYFSKPVTFEGFLDLAHQLKSRFL